MTETDHLVPDAAGILHASTVAFQGSAVLIAGRSGSGKSRLALQLLSLGAGLVADDRTIVTTEGGSLIATCPPPIDGLIEARGVGLLRADPVGPTPVRLIVDMEHTETHRLPPERTVRIQSVEITMLYAVPEAYFPAAIAQYMKAGRNA